MSEEQTTAPQHINPYLIPGAIVIAGICIAGAVIMTQGSRDAEESVAPSGRVLEAEVLPITENDHVFGSRDADVFLIEYSDYRCGYCGIFHNTITEVLDTYDGRVAWVYRHTPYQSGGMEAAVASECIAELAGEDAFWEYTDRAFANQKDLSPEWSKTVAEELGADGGTYDACMESGKYDALIKEHTQNAQQLGGRGTPYNVLMTRNGDVIKFSGAQPIDNVVLLIERALRSLEK